MSATRDKTHKVTFVYQNLHALYRQGLAAAKAAQVPGVPGVTPATGSASGTASNPIPSDPAADPAADSAANLRGVIRGRVLKRENLAAENGSNSIANHQPTLLMGKRLGDLAPAVEKPSLTIASQREAIKSLQDNLKTLGDLHSRLRFMLKELEDLVKE